MNRVHALPAALRGEIRPGDILAWKGHGFFAWVVRIATGSDFSHVGVATSEYFVLEANPRLGVVFRPLARMLPAYHIATGARWNAGADAFASSVVGRRYSVLDGVLAWAHIRTVSPGFQCAELVRDVLSKAGVDTPPACTIPDDLVYHFIDAGMPMRFITS